jgi:hypothetical protein
MGHIRLGKLPATRRWQQVVALIADGASVENVAGASAKAAENSLDRAQNDPALIRALWLLTQIPLAARTSDFAAALRALQLPVSNSPTLLEIGTALSDAVDRQVEREGGRTDLGELAQHAAVESLATLVAADLPGLFGPTAADVRIAVGRLAAPDRFARLARDFFARLTRSHLEYYLSRTLSDHVGPGRRFSSIQEHAAFKAALEQHCFEAARIVERFAGGWFSKTHFETGITPEKARGFVFVALRKIGRELRRRRLADV